MRVSATRPSSSIKNQTWMEAPTPASFKSGGYSAINSLVSSGTLSMLGATVNGVKVPGGIIRRDGSFEQLGAKGPPLGMMGGFQYNSQCFPMGVGDTAFVLSHGSQGLFQGAADPLAQLHGKPAGDIVSSLHKAIRKAQGDERSETSVLYVRKH